jgi:hypothetical protein
MSKGPDRRVLVEPALGGESERIDAAQARVRRVLDFLFDRCGRQRLGGFLQ